MKYLKCVHQLQSRRETNFKLGVIYELKHEPNENYVITSTDTDNGSGEAFTYIGYDKDDDFQEWVKSWCKFEEVTYTDYILQEFVNSNIAIKFQDYKACEYWAEKLIKACEDKDVDCNGWEFGMAVDFTNDPYYVNYEYKKVKNDSDYDTIKVVLLPVQENKKENENMKKEFKEFTKSSLMNGMIVKTRRGELYLVHRNSFMNQNGFTRNEFDNYKDNLTSDYSDAYDIMYIYESKATVIDEMFNEYNLELIWERNEVEDLTEREYKFELLTISPNGDNYLEDEDGIFIKKEDTWEDDCSEVIAISLEEAEFLIKSLTEIVSTIKNN